MKTITAKEAKNKFGDLIDRVQHEPVRITLNGRDVAVVISQVDYEKYLAAIDEAWAQQADDAAAEGFLTPKASRTFLDELLNA